MDPQTDPMMPSEYLIFRFANDAFECEEGRAVVRSMFSTCDPMQEVNKESLASLTHIHTQTMKTSAAGRGAADGDACLIA